MMTPPMIFKLASTQMPPVLKNPEDMEPCNYKTEENITEVTMMAPPTHHKENSNTNLKKPPPPHNKHPKMSHHHTS